MNIISLVLEKLFKLIDNDKNDTDNDNNYLKFFYIVIIYSSFIHYSKYTFSLIYDKNLFKSLLKYTNDLIIINNIFFSLKINKLLIFGLSKILYENDFLKIIIAYFKDAFTINYNLISKQLAEEVKESKNKNLINDENNENNENNNKKNNNDYLAKKISDIINKELILPKLEFDEYDIFNKLYKKLMGINETKNIINEIINLMDEDTKKEFENILLTKKINISKGNNQDMVDDNNEEVVHRRIVKIRKSSM